jgi:serine/threonine protein kinase
VLVRRMAEEEAGKEAAVPSPSPSPSRPSSPSRLRPALELVLDPPLREPGTLLLSGKYRLETPLAVGGMSTVWLATHVTLGRSVAVKFIDLASNERSRTHERFLREARLAASIHHPNVIDVVDFGIAENGEPVMVMELLEGEPLSLRLAAEPPLGAAAVVHVMSQVLSALEAVHRAGILHCDMKPANVMLGPIASSDENGATTDGSGEGASEIFAWLIDFGIAFSIDPRSDLRRGRFGTDLHMVTGTPEYMAPEQAEGRTDLDERVDVYAASVMLYEMLAGVCPFTDEHPGRVLYKVIQGTHVPLALLRPDLPELASVVALGMSHDREARPKSARELRRMLLDAIRRESTARTLPPPPRNERAELAEPLAEPVELPTLVRALPEPEARTDGKRAPTRRTYVRRWAAAFAYVLGAIMIGIVLYGTSSGPEATRIAAIAPEASPTSLPRRAVLEPPQISDPVPDVVATLDEPAPSSAPAAAEIANAPTTAIVEPEAATEEVAPVEPIVVVAATEPHRSRHSTRPRAETTPSDAPAAPAPEISVTADPSPTDLEFVEDPGF